MSISRLSLFMLPWAALALITAAGLFPLLMWHLRALGLNPFLFVVVCVVYIAVATLAARAIVLWQRR